MRIEAADAGSTPFSPGNWTDVASASVSGATSVGRSSSTAKSSRSASVPWTSAPAEPRSSAAMPSGRKTAAARYSGNGISVRAATCAASASKPWLE